MEDDVDAEFGCDVAADEDELSVEVVDQLDVGALLLTELLDESSGDEVTAELIKEDDDDDDDRCDDVWLDELDDSEDEDVAADDE